MSQNYRRRLQRQRDELEEERWKLMEDIDQSNEGIKKQLQDLKKQLEIIASAMIKELQQKGEAQERMLNRKIDDLKTRLQSVKINWQDSQGKEGDAENEVNEGNSESRNTRFDTKTSITFTKRKPKIEELTSLFGQVNVHCSLRDEVDYEPANTLKVNIEHNPISGICPVSDTSAWIVSGKTLRLCSKDGSIESSLWLGESVSDVAMDSLGQVFVAGCNNIYRITGPRKTVKVFSLPECASGMVINHEDEFIICCNTKGKLLKFSSEGKLLRDINNVGNGPIMERPYKVTVNINEDIVVIGYSDGDDVEIFDNLGRLKTVVNGYGMDLHDVCHNRQGFLLAVDYKADDIKLFSAWGQYIRSLIKVKRKPWTLCMDNVGDIWVGCADGNVIMYRRQLSPNGGNK